MSLINRNITRTILNSTEKTLYTSSPSSDSLSFAMTTSDAFYVGYKEKFQSRYFFLSTVSAGSATVTVKYWDGTAYTAFDDVIDQTLGFTRNGFISWTLPENATWEKVAQSGVTEELYWIKITVSATLTSAVLQLVDNLFCDAVTLRSYYPELVSDTAYLPPSRTDFMEQFIAAKDLVVTRLKQDKIIEDESQILDVNEVAIAATHAAAWIILSPIARDQGDIDRAKQMFADFNRELNQSKKSFDFNNSGKIEDDEKNVGTVVICRR